MENSFNSLIASSKSIQIILPTRPFFDQVAAALGMFLTLSSKKEVSIYSPNEMTVEFNRLVGVNKVSSDLGSKNLILKFKNYFAENIERVSYDIEDGEFKLTVIPKPSAASPKKENLDISFSGISADLVLLIGGANETHFPVMTKDDLKGINMVHVGNKDLVTSTGVDVISFARPSSSVSEIVVSLFENSEFEIGADAATNLLMGIEDASKSFSSKDVTADTFEKVAFLLRKGGRRIGEMEVAQRDTFPKGSIPGENISEEDRTLLEMAPKVQGSPNMPEGQDKDQLPQGWQGPKIYKGDSMS